jgi:UDP-glucose 4-epimerase
MLLVTGCNGYVGELLIQRLKNEKVEFHCIDLSECKHNLTSHSNCDITNKIELDDLKKQYGPFEGVIHLAAIKTVVSNGLESELLMKRVNQNGTKNIIALLKEDKSSFFIFASSAAVYGDNTHQEVIQENFSLTPLSLYGETKLHGENTLRDSFERGLVGKVICLRFFNIAGHEKTSLNPGYVLGGAICHAAKAYHQGGVFTVYGTTFDSHDGTAIRDYVHVLDVVESIFKSYRVASDCTDRLYESVNICTGVGTSLLDVISRINNQIKDKLKVNFQSSRIGEIEFSIGNPSKALGDIDWRPEIDISTIISSELDYHKNKS